MRDASVILTWPFWSVALFLLPAILVWVVGGIPGGLAIFPVRLVLLLALLAVPSSGVLFHLSPDNPSSLEIVVAGTPDSSRLNARWSARYGADRSGDERMLVIEPSRQLLVRVVTGVRAAPLWWMPPEGRVREIGVGPVGAVPEVLRFDESVLLPDVRSRIERFLRRHRLLQTVESSIQIPEREAHFLQPGRYRVTLDTARPHPGALSYRYTQQ